MDRSYPYHLGLAFAWLTALDQLNVTQLPALSTDDFTALARPASLNFGPPRTKDQFLGALKTAPTKTFNIRFRPSTSPPRSCSYNGIYIQFSLPATENTVETPDVVQFYTTTDGQTSHGFPWKNEYIFTFRFTGDKIKSTVEFYDPIAFQTALGKEAKFTCP